MNVFFKFDVLNLLLKNNGVRDRRPNFIIFVFWSALNFDGWVVVGWSIESCLGPAEISSLCFWMGMGIQGESKISSFVCDVNQGNKEFGYKKAGSRFSCEAPGIERFAQDLPQVVESGMWVCAGENFITF